MTLGRAGIGVGVLSHVVRERRTEIKMRMVQGAPRPTILRIVIRPGLPPTVSGIVLDLLGAFWLTRFMASFLVHVQPSDPVIYNGTAALWASIGQFAEVVQARRAAGVHPMEALREG
ncbi:MAG: hypothetical protein PVJ02_18695 [Gemmatimonadota bacterium]